MTHKWVNRVRFTSFRLVLLVKWFCNISLFVKISERKTYQAWLGEKELRLQAVSRNRGVSRVLWRQSIVVVCELSDGETWCTDNTDTVYRSPSILIDQEDLVVNGGLNVPPGTDVVPSWAIRVRASYWEDAQSVWR